MKPEITAAIGAGSVASTAIGRKAALTLIAFSMLSLATGAAADDSTGSDELPSRATTVVIVRHAEKVDGSRDPALSAAGHERAQALAEAVEHAGLDAAYASQFQRTRLTALPAALAAGLAVNTNAVSGDITAWAGNFAVELLQRHPGQTVLVAGHSNTVPPLVAALCRCDVEPLTDGDYDRLFIINGAGGEDPSLIIARYGASASGPR